MRLVLGSWLDMRGSLLPRRTVAMLLTALAHILILLALLRSTAFQFQPPNPDRQLTTFNIAPEAPKAVVQTRQATRSRRATPPPPPSPQPPTPPKEGPAAPWVLVPGLEHFDLRQVRSTAPVRQAQADASAEADAGDSSSVYGPSSAPGGGRLFNAEWYREPTDAELGFYMPRGVIGWGIIACQTVERFHVDNCRELGESPPGSRMSRAMVEAAWQFLVRPPRINGKAMVGAWVRIRIDLTPDGGKVRRSR